MRPIRVSYNARALAAFRARAKAAFPSEIWGLLLGHDYGLRVRRVEVASVWIPDDVLAHCTPNEVREQDHWWIEGAEYARDRELCVVGWIHSHPYTRDEIKRGMGRDIAPSAVDLTLYRWDKLSAILLLLERRGGLVSKLAFWGPMVPVRVVEKSKVAPQKTHA